MIRLSSNVKILAKSALIKEQLDTKVNIGCDGIEIQLLSELINGRIGNYYLAKDVYDLDMLKNYDIYCIHAPILSFYGLDDVNIEDMVDMEDFKLLDQIFYIANTVGELYNRKIIVVVHSEMSRDKLIGLGDTWKRVLNAVGCMLFKYPYTELAIENITPLRNAHRKPLHLANNFLFDNIIMASELRKQLNTDRVGTVLDICHAKTTALYMNKIYELLGDEPEDYSLNNFFSGNKDVIKLIHLADMTGSGYGKGEHGIKITDSNKDTLEEVIELYNKYSYNCPITLEVEETDFIKSDGYADTKALIDKYKGS